MGSKAIQSKLWGQRPGDWGAIQEKTGTAGYEYVLSAPDLRGANLLDIGCGTGYFCGLAQNQYENIAGIDATAEFIDLAKKRVPNARFFVGEMEELPFVAQSFDVVCGFNSFQYAADIKNALAEAARVLIDDGYIALMIWGNPEDCEAATYLKAVGSLLPPPAPGTPGPFALSQDNLLENLLTGAGFSVLSSEDIATVWLYPDSETALRGLMSAGPVAKAIENSGFEKAKDVITTAIKPFTNENGEVTYHNKFRVVIGKK